MDGLGGLEQPVPPGPPLPELDDRARAELDGQSDAIVRNYQDHVADRPFEYRQDPPWLVPGDRWIAEDWHDDAAERFVETHDLDDDRTLGAMECLLRHGRDACRERVRDSLDRWWDAGGHDMQDWDDLIALFPDHPAAEFLTNDSGLPSASALRARLPARRHFRFRLADELRELRDGNDEDLAEHLDSVFTTCLAIGEDWTRRLVSAGDLDELQARSLELLRRSGQELRPWLPDLTRAAALLDFPGVIDAVVAHPDLTGILFSESRRAEDVEREVAALFDDDDETPDSGLDDDDRSPKVRHVSHDEHHFDEILLAISSRRRSGVVERMAAQALRMVASGRPRLEDTLAAAISWKRCRADGS